MDLQHLLGVVVAILHHHQHALFLYHFLDDCVDDLLHFVRLLHRTDQPALEIDGDEVGAELVLGQLVWIRGMVRSSYISSFLCIYCFYSKILRMLVWICW